jgi:hypothetical protein
VIARSAAATDRESALAARAMHDGLRRALAEHGFGGQSSQVTPAFGRCVVVVGACCSESRSRTASGPARRWRPRSG